MQSVVAVLRANTDAVFETAEWKALDLAVRAKATQAVLSRKPYESIDD